MSRFNLICFKTPQVLFRVVLATGLFKELRLKKGKIGEDEVVCEWLLEYLLFINYLSRARSKIMSKVVISYQLGSSEIK